MINFAFLQFNAKFTVFEFQKPMKTEVLIKDPVAHTKEHCLEKYFDKACQFSVLKGISCESYFKNF